jgi:hypothetical protein
MELPPLATNKILIILMLLFLIACHSPKKDRVPLSKAESQKIREDLVGVWKCDQSRSKPKDENITMTISNDGRIVYDIENTGEIERFDLIYAVREDTLLTKKLTDPTEIRSLIKFENANTLKLEAYGKITTFTRSTTAQIH